MNIVLAAIVGYLIGGIPTGIWVSRAVKGVDPRTIGSGSSGATNISRILGRKWAIIVLVLDALKGYLPVMLVPLALAPGTDPVSMRIVVAFGTVLGHVFTPYAKFRGGKGIATAAGAMLALDPTAVGVALLGWLLVFAIFRRVSVASLAAAIALPVSMMALGGRPRGLIHSAMVMFCFLVFTHRENIRRLLAKQEQPLA